MLTFAIVLNGIVVYTSQWNRQLAYGEFYRMLEDNPTSKRVVEA